MSVIIAKGEQIKNSPINQSKSKMMYSFSKSVRFDEIKLKGCKSFSYNLPDFKNNRSTSQGYGKKYDFIIKHINKKVPYYEIPSEFNPKKPNTPAFSFGIASHHYDRVNVIFKCLNFIFILKLLNKNYILGLFKIRKNIR